MPIALPQLRIVGVSAKVSYLPSTKFNLREIANKIKTEFSSSIAEKSKKTHKKGRVQIKFQSPTPATVHVFRSCQFLIMHAKSEDDVKQIASQMDMFLAKTMSFSPNAYTLQIFNITGTCDLGLEKLLIGNIFSEARNLGSHILPVYEPEVFPGLVWKRRFDGASHLICVGITAFSSGKLTLTGSSDIGKLQFALREFCEFADAVGAGITS